MQPFVAASLESPVSPPVTMSHPAPSVMPEDSPQSLVGDPIPSVVSGGSQQPELPTVCGQHPGNPEISVNLISSSVPQFVQFPGLLLH